MQFPVDPPRPAPPPAVRDNSSGNGSANVKSRKQQKFNKMETIKCTEFEILDLPQKTCPISRFLLQLTFDNLHGREHDAVLYDEVML
ncbi:uncharacterized protein DMAD_05417 [Drosophila madeirensis]|uniref:Uncharacterized protein n=1 Tax=Drosophila madeirensis TaxID=30013 RepID=A0AAU9FM62_DROMD